MATTPGAPSGASPDRPGGAAASTGAPPPVSSYGAVVELFAALAAPVRAAIVHRLAEQGPRTVGELVEDLGVTQPLVSQHLRVLRGARLVVGERRGREVAYSLLDEHVAHVFLDALHHSGEPVAAGPATG